MAEEENFKGVEISAEEEREKVLQVLEMRLAQVENLTKGPLSRNEGKSIYFIH